MLVKRRIVVRGKKMDRLRSPAVVAKSGSLWGAGERQLSSCDRIATERRASQIIGSTLCRAGEIMLFNRSVADAGR